MRDISELAAKDRAMLLGLSSGALAAYLLLHSGNLNDGEDEFLSKYLAELENKKRFEKLNGPFHTYDCKAY